MNNISYWINEDKHSLAIANELIEIYKDKEISKKDILRAAKDFVKIVRNETIDKEKIKETRQRPGYYNYDLFDAIMEAREVQAKNLAQRLISFGLPVVIIG